MRRRPPPVPALDVALDERLRRFRAEEWPEPDGSTPQWPDDDRGYPTRGHIRAYRRWLDARRAWEAGSGVTFAELRQRELSAAGTLVELNAVYAPGRFIDVDEPDPRWP